MKKNAKINKTKNKQLEVYIENTQDIHALVKIIFPVFVRIIRIEKHGKIYIVKVKVNNSKVHCLAISSTKSDISLFKTRLKENCEKETGSAVIKKAFDLIISKEENTNVISFIHRLSKFYLLLFYFELNRTRINKIILASLNS